MAAIAALEHRVKANVALAPFRDWPALWAWMHEHPEAHMDDQVPGTYEAFAAEMDRRIEHGERVYGVFVDGQAVGSIGYQPLTPRVGMLHGVAISRAVSGRGIADTALKQLLALVQAEGVKKVSAAYFADNAHIRSCLKRVGFVDEGFLQDHTTRNGLPLSLWLVAAMVKG